MQPVLKSTKLANVCYDIRGPVLARARQMEELWRLKLSQQETDYRSREAISAEEIRSQMRRERAADTNGFTCVYWSLS